jgi:hypothetical protein
MDINLATFVFLFLRLSPFILICFFTLSSIFNSDLRGIVYLFGLLWAIFTSFIVGNSVDLGGIIDNDSRNAVCDISLFGNGDSSHIPIGETIIGYTFFYLFTTLILKDRNYINKTINFENIPNIPSLGECFVTPWQMLSLDFLKFIPSIFLNVPSTKDNLPTILFFLSLILFDIFWNTNLFRKIKEIMNVDLRYCYTGKQSVFAYGIGIVIGIIWSNIIFATNTPSLQYFPEYKNNEVCKKASPTKYKCKVYKNGELIKTMD